MDVSQYFRSLSTELNSLKDRVRYLIDDGHWQTDGEWKESVLRSILRRHLPKTVEVGSGFFVAPDAHSNQIDVLIYDNSKPVLFKESDLVFVATDAAQAVIEVKASIRSYALLEEVLIKLADQSEFIFERTPGNQFQTKPPFVGLFAYDWHGGHDPERVLDALRVAATQNGANPHTRIVNHVSLGDEWFFRYWQSSPDADRGANYCRWHAYELGDRSFGYFIHNVIDSISTQAVDMNPGLWFPREGKERHLASDRSLFG